jgi:beta-galactosidase GanA
MNSPRVPTAMTALLLGLGLLFVSASPSLGSDDAIPQLRRQGSATQLFVDGKPFLVLGGELRNSSSSSLAYMEPIWPRLEEQNLNTVLTGVSWELIEPEEGHFDFRELDGLIEQARVHHMHLGLLWLASWKNGMSSYAPIWVKRDARRFPRVRLAGGEEPEVLSTLGGDSAAADARAFGALMTHLASFDSHSHTVVIVQVENEVGILGDSRDRSPAAEAAFNGPVPKEWFAYAEANKADLVPELVVRWDAAGSRNSGTWTEVFGGGPATDEIFMAWNYARYVEQVAAAGAAAYPLPLYANAWLNEIGSKPGDYPSGCPESHVLNFWKAGAPHLSLLAPDLYSPNFDERCRLFTRCGNPLFIPETNRNAQSARNLFLAVGSYRAIGFSPFAIDAVYPPSMKVSDEDRTALEKAYGLLRQVAPLVLEHQSKGDIVGFVLDKDHPSLRQTLGGSVLEISLDEIFGHRAEHGGGLVMAIGPGIFLGVGSGFRVIFHNPEGRSGTVGIAAVTEGTYKDGAWMAGRRLNGDEDDQGRAWRFSSWESQIESCMIYNGY